MVIHGTMCIRYNSLLRSDAANTNITFDYYQQVEKLHGDHKLICLSCRYTVDVLLDLKTVCMETSTKFNEIISKGIDYLTFPKVILR